MRALITGSVGFVATNLRHELERVKWETILFDKRNGQDLLEHFSELDKAVQQADVVFHLAAIPSHRLSMDKPELVIKNNYTSTLNVAEFCRIHKKKVVFCSSFSVYGNQSTPWTEETPLSPQTPYAHSKVMSEQVLKLYHDIYGLNVIIARLSNVFGPYETLHEPKQVIPTWLDQTKQGQVITVHGCETTRDFTYVYDVCRALYLLSRLKGFHVYNVCSGEETKLSDVAHWITANVTIQDLPSHEATRWVGTNDKLKMLEWAPTKDVYSWVKEEVLKRGIREWTPY